MDCSCKLHSLSTAAKTPCAETTTASLRSGLLFSVCVIKSRTCDSRSGEPTDEPPNLRTENKPGGASDATKGGCSLPFSFGEITEFATTTSDDDDTSGCILRFFGIIEKLLCITQQCSVRVVWCD